jgi:undecaprenyl-diphosphatase
MLAAEPILTPLQAFVLGAVQGLTELLPVSSSAHLFLVPTLLGWPYAGVAFDVAMHAGTLLALVVAFWSDWVKLLGDAVSPDPGLRTDARATLGMILIATVPALIAGKVLYGIEDRLRIVPLQATMLLVFGIVLWLADKYSGPGKDERAPGWGPSLGMGLAQGIALMPGVSRSGITMTIGRMGGLSRIAAARFSFLMSLPITLAAVSYTMLKDGRTLVSTGLPLGTLLIGVASSALFGFIAIRFMLSLLRSRGYGGFAAYRVVFALALFAWVLLHPHAVQS